jgi:molecular chaperone DnaK
MPEYYVGIDLGTTNTIASVLRKGKIETIMVEGDPICPSVVHFSDKDGTVVGRNAKRRMLIDPERTIVSVKRNMGSLKFRYRQNGTEYTPADISSFILKKVKQEAEKELGAPLRKAVITVPAYFNDDQRAQTKKAAEMAGFEVLRLLSEPTAAALAYGINQGKNQTLVVYDLGGGTFDISILEVKGNTFTVKAIGGDTRLGGDDFDRALMNYVLAEFRKSTGIDLKSEPKSPELLVAQQRLKEKCQESKEQLSVVEETVVEIPGFYRGRHLEVSISRGRFEELISPCIARSTRITLETLKKANLGKGDIDRVILVGGSTRIPYVKQEVAKSIKEPYTADNVMEMVARGAAFMAAQYMAIHDKGDEMIKEIVKVSSLQELTRSYSEINAFRIGIATVGIVSNREAHRFQSIQDAGRGMSVVSGIFSEVVQLGKKIPLTARRDGYTTVRDNQDTVDVEVFRTSEAAGRDQESCHAGGMQFLGQFKLSGIPPVRAGKPQISITMEIDENGILVVEAEEKATPARGQKSFHLSVDREIDGIEEDEDGDCWALPA